MQFQLHCLSRSGDKVKFVHHRTGCYNLNVIQNTPYLLISFFISTRSETSFRRETVHVLFSEAHQYGCEICFYYLSFKQPIFPFRSYPEHKCTIRHCVIRTKQQETSATPNSGAKLPFTLKPKCLHFIATAFQNIPECLGGPYKGFRVENNGNRPRGVLRNVTTCVTNYMSIGNGGKSR